MTSLLSPGRWEMALGAEEESEGQRSVLQGPGEGLPSTCSVRAGMFVLCMNCHGPEIRGFSSSKPTDMQTPGHMPMQAGLAFTNNPDPASPPRGHWHILGRGRELPCHVWLPFRSSRWHLLVAVGLLRVPLWGPSCLSRCPLPPEGRALPVGL